MNSSFFLNLNNNLISYYYIIFKAVFKAAFNARNNYVSFKFSLSEHDILHDSLI